MRITQAVASASVAFAMLTYAVAISHDAEPFVRVWALVGLAVATCAGLLFAAETIEHDKVDKQG